MAGKQAGKPGKAPGKTSDKTSGIASAGTSSPRVSETGDPFHGVSELTSCGLEAGFGDRVLQPPKHARIFQVQQVHGARICSVEDVAPEAPDSATGVSALEADGIAISGLPAPDAELTVAAIRTADCVPVLIAAAGDDGSSCFAAAVHAGWRGTVAAIAEHAVARARSCGIEPGRLHARLGPSIGPCCYEVGEDVATRFEQQGLPVRRSPGSVKLDLREANRLLLQRAGVRSDRILDSGPCTRCCADRYFSYRAEPGSGGRQLSWVGWGARAR
jgi:YfiH family protein